MPCHWTKSAPPNDAAVGRKLESLELAFSPDARWIVFTSRDNVYVAAMPDIATKEPAEVSLKEGAVPVWRVSDAAGAYAGWADGGKTLTWSLGPTFYRLGLDAAVRFAQEERRKAEEKEKEKGAGAAAAKDKRKSEAEKKDDDELKLPPAEAIEIRLTTGMRTLYVAAAPRRPVSDTRAGV